MLNRKFQICVINKVMKGRKRIKSGKAAGSNPVELWECLGEVAVVSDWTV